MPNGRIKKAPMPPENSPTVSGQATTPADVAQPVVERVMGSRQQTGKSKGPIVQGQAGAMGYVNTNADRFFQAGPKYAEQFMNHPMVTRYPDVQKRAEERYQSYFKKPYVRRKK